MKIKYKYIDSDKYIKTFSNPRWYMKIPELSNYFWSNDNNKERSQDWHDERNEFVALTAELLESGNIALAADGPDMDKARRPVDTIVIHHSHRPGADLQTISALGLFRLYVPVYLRKDGKYCGDPIWSGHFYENKQTFIAYHYIVDNDGSYYHVLDDREIGWQAGDWEMNTRSIAICFNDDLTDKLPSDLALESARQIIENYKNCNILGHREVNKLTTCPGNKFLGEGGWSKLLE